ncbi:DUF3419 family protein [Candidatus Woesearchaeota archaeon]|nr:DUF3419 family protein [Candidatus Woesearchaeota archaeon]
MAAKTKKTDEGEYVLSMELKIKKENMIVNTKKEQIMGSIAPMYIYSTEMVTSYYSKLNIKNKNVLTTCGSGDQVLNAYLLGAKEVVGFDLNIRSEFIIRLKIAAIKIFTYKEFLIYFGRKMENSSLNYKLYKKIRSSLDKRTLIFFDRLYNKYNFSGTKLVKSCKYFRQRSKMKCNLKLINLYLKNEKEYFKLRNILFTKNFRFINSDFVSISSNKLISKDKFEIINLSNIPNYFFGRYLKKNKIIDPFGIFYHTLNELRKLLSYNGIIFYYCYCSNNDLYKIKGIPPPSRNANIDKMQEILNFKVFKINFKSILGKGFDRIIVLQS